MKQRRFSALFLAVLVVFSSFLLASCKSSGMAVTAKGQFLKIDIQGADDLPEGGTDEMVVSIANRGVNNVLNLYVDVEIPGEITVQSEVHEKGMETATDRGPSGDRVYHYTIGNLQPGETSVARFAVRTAFGTMDRTGDVKVTAWQSDLPGNKLVETKHIKLRR